MFSLISCFDSVTPEESDDPYVDAFLRMSYKILNYSVSYTKDHNDPVQDFTIALVNRLNGYEMHDYALGGAILGYLADEKHKQKILMGTEKPYSPKDSVAVGIPTNEYNSLLSTVKRATGYNVEKKIIAESGGYTWVLADKHFFVEWYYNDGFADWRSGDPISTLIPLKQSIIGEGDFGTIISRTPDEKYFLKLTLKRFCSKKATEI